MGNSKFESFQYGGFIRDLLERSGRNLKKYPFLRLEIENRYFFDFTEVAVTFNSTEFRFPCSADHKKDWQPYRDDHAKHTSPACTLLNNNRPFC